MMKVEGDTATKDDRVWDARHKNRVVGGRKWDIQRHGELLALWDRGHVPYEKARGPGSLCCTGYHPACTDTAQAIGHRASLC